MSTETAGFLSAEAASDLDRSSAGRMAEVTA